MEDWHYREYLENINKEKKQLLERLDKYKFFSKDNYDLFLSILNLEVNVWNINIPDDVFKIPDTIFGDIVKFNLKNYMLIFLGQKVDKEILDYSADKNLFRVELWMPIASMNLCKDEEGKRPKGILKLYKHFYDKDYNKARIEFMKKLLNLYKLRSNYNNIDAILLRNEITRMENVFDNGGVILDESVSKQYTDSRAILDVLLDEYGIEFPELKTDDSIDYSTFWYSERLGQISLETDLDKFWYLNALVKIFNESRITSTSCIQDDEKGKVYAIKYIRDLYQKDTE